MALPRKLKQIMLFQDGASWLGEVISATPPKLARKLEEYRGAGMDTPVKLDMGGEAMDFEFTAAGPLREAIAAYGGSMTGTMLRFVAVYERDDTGAIEVCEHIVRGRYEEIDFGDLKPGELGDFKGKLSLAYYRQEWDGVVAIEIDPLAGIRAVNGVNLLAGVRSALGF
jgi:P2 family phage contractile tail tube protein